MKSANRSTCLDAACVEGGRDGEAGRTRVTDRQTDERKRRRARRVDYTRWYIFHRYALYRINLGIDTWMMLLSEFSSFKTGLGASMDHAFK